METVSSYRFRFSISRESGKKEFLEISPKKKKKIGILYFLAFPSISEAYALDNKLRNIPRYFTEFTKNNFNKDSIKSVNRVAQASEFIENLEEMFPWYCMSLMFEREFSINSEA